MATPLDQPPKVTKVPPTQEPPADTPSMPNHKKRLMYGLLAALVLLAAIVGALWWSLADNNASSQQSTVPDTTNDQSEAAQSTLPDNWVEYDIGVYKFKYPDNKAEITFSYMDFFGRDGPDETFKNIVAFHKGTNGDNTLFDISIQKNVDWESGISPIEGLDLEEAAKRSHEANKSDPNPNYEVKVGELEQVQLGDNTVYSFTTNIGFVTDYNNPTDGSGFVLGDSTTLRAYFLGSKSGDIIRIVVDDNDQLAKEILQTISTR